MHFASVKEYSVSTFPMMLGISKEGPSPRHLLPVVALPRPPIPPRTQGGGALQLCLSSAAGGGMRQPLPLHQDRPAHSASDHCTYQLETQQRSTTPNQYFDFEHALNKTLCLDSFTGSRAAPAGRTV